MNVPIDAGAGLIFLASTAVGYAVHRHSKAASPTTPPTGDLGVAFTTGSITLVALAFLFGVPTSATELAPTPATTSTQTTTPAAANPTVEPTAPATPDPVAPPPSPPR
ncbi:hypothetical protein QTO28_32810 [Streptomyces sp. P9-2B-1]|uniref:hypothetical protein n=1 Tax=Streptomyces sp. P9-2B-1 TaxID=3057115 RepID=UPI0025B460A4|nr:hypothetical protein [Streptomyces sp. P9-2B-1]WJY29453.1 hypothetical protein QTO28_00015 [Streptomyces sp. P9-2B-1]WJY35518.1 hypothetical protein QTO28_32810 [Streptomyces sp. P9-2B-1]